MHPPEPQAAPSLLSSDDLHLFNEGTHADLQRKLGAHLVDEGDGPGAQFAVWAPNASYVTVFGDFNDWDKHANPLKPKD
ncbi:MAG: 1,4-alpha-glucan branching enzyme, partial [Actinomycetota bacterium]